MIAVIERTPDGPALLVHGVRVAEKSVGDTTLQALADQINAAAGWRPIAEADRVSGKEILGVRWASTPQGWVCTRSPFISFWSPTLRKFYCDPTHFQEWEPPDDM